MGARILVVEDNAFNADMLVRRLARRGFEMRVAGDGQVAIDEATTWQPDLILMDISLPVIDGLEATRRLKAAKDTAAIPVIALTANAMVTDRNASLAAGCADFETKPVDLDRLLDKIAASLASRPVRP